MDSSTSEDCFRKISNSRGQTQNWRRNVLDADAKWLVWAESRFASIAGKDTDIDRESFKNALGIRNVFFADRFFDMLDNDQSGTISQQEMMDGLFLLTKGTKEEKLRFFFDVYDLDESGNIEKDELRALLKTGVEESSLDLSDQKVDHLTETLFNTADQNSDGSISFDEFMTALKRYPDLLENFSIGAAAWLKDTRPKRRGCRGIPWLRVNYLRNNIQRIALLLIIILVTGVVFAEAAYRHSFNPDANWSFLIARGCGQALNFNCAIIVLMMLRKTLSFLRSSTLLMQILPFDDNIMFHKFIGYLAAILALAHTLGHVGNALILETYKNFTAVELLFTDPTLLPVGLRVGKLVGSAFITGWLLDLVFLVLILGSLSCVRRSGHFEIFNWTHKICYFLFWFLLILHGPVFWAWFVGPLILFLLEKFSNLQIIRRIRHGKTYVKEANLLPSGVTHLVMTKPRHFKYKAGDYVFIKIPEIAMNEWHPFTISSAPEQAGILSLHIRSAGNWTKRLYRFFDDMQSTTKKKSQRVKSFHHEKSLSDAGQHVNAGFEMTPKEDRKSSNGTPLSDDPKGPTVDRVDDTAVRIATNDSPTSLDEVEPPSVMKVSRVSFNSEVDPQTFVQSKKTSLPSTIPEADEELLELSVIKVDRGHENQSADVEKVDEETGKECEDTTTIPEVDAAASKNRRHGVCKGNNLVEQTSESMMTPNGPTAYFSGQVSKDNLRPQVLFDMNINNKLQNDENSTSCEATTSSEEASNKREQAVCKPNALVKQTSRNMMTSNTEYYSRKHSKAPPRPQILFDMNTNNKIQVHIQGPYGTPSTSVFESEHAVLIGAGIGVTPFASIMQSIMCRHRSIVTTCPNCQHTWVDEEREKQALRIKKVDFIWLNRNHTAFEWFVDMLLNLEQGQSQYSLDRFLDIHLFMTGIQRFDMKNVGLQMALDLVHKQENRDMLTGLRTQLQAGRPDWNKLFKEIQEEGKGRVSVFFCGSPALGRIINKHCQKFGFIFHKENF